MHTRKRPVSLRYAEQHVEIVVLEQRLRPFGFFRGGAARFLAAAGINILSSFSFSYWFMMMTRTGPFQMLHHPYLIS